MPVANISISAELPSAINVEGGQHDERFLAFFLTSHYFICTARPCLASSRCERKGGNYGNLSDLLCGGVKFATHNLYAGRHHHLANDKQ
eukprot:scaffold47791_cov18-Prasinocladus_malaysianus.AAC.1